MKIKDQFDITRKAWPGDKNGIDPEWATFLKVCKKHKLEIAETVLLLLPAIERYKTYCSARRDRSEWVETCAHFQTWLNDRRWLKEHPALQQFKFKQETQHSDDSEWIMEQTPDKLKAFIQRWPNYADRIKQLRPEIFND